jgi:aryl-alcohol dehydrogenase-like predicted oxidoreductase
MTASLAFSSPTTSLPVRQLGALRTPALGLGCMGMSDFYGPRDDEQSLRTLAHAVERGVTLLDTADMYGPHTNELLIGRFLREQQARSKVLIATKFGIVRDPNDATKRGINGTPAYVRRAVEGSLQRLGVDVIDLYQQHRVDPNTPIEDTIGALSDLVTEGKVRFIGLSEAGPKTLRRAHAVHPISSVQTEYSLWSRDVESAIDGESVLGVCHSLGIGLLAYSPLGRGFLTGQITSPDDFAADDYRRMSPRFQGENFTKNLALVQQVANLAAEKGCTPAQLALAWVLAQAPFIVPIPGTRRIAALDDNIGAVDVQLSARDLARIDAVFPANAAAGTRYPAAMMGSLNG